MESVPQLTGGYLKAARHNRVAGQFIAKESQRRGTCRQWVVSEIEYAELTADEQLRQTTFLGWRDDKKPKEIVLE